MTTSHNTTPAPNTSAGSVSSFIALNGSWTAERAIHYLRRVRPDADLAYYLYVVDPSGKLEGVVSLRDLIIAQPGVHLSEIMNADVRRARDDMDQEEMARMVQRYDLVALPVVDAEERLVGVITVDDVLDVVEEEATEDIQKLGAVQKLGEPYLEVPLWRMIRKRAGWLAALFLGEMLTATAMGQFQEEIVRAVVLALFVPLIISSGGNSGSQATTLVIRAMALGEVRLRDWWRVVARELSTGLALGLILATIGLVRIVAWQGFFHAYGEHYVLVALTVAFSLIGVVVWGSVAGSVLPFILRGLGLDPASASAPLAASATVQPAFCRVRRKMSRVLGSSSTTRTCALSWPRTWRLTARMSRSRSSGLVM